MPENVTIESGTNEVSSMPNPNFQENANVEFDMVSFDNPIEIDFEVLVPNVPGGD